MDFKIQLYNTLKEWQVAEKLAHDTCNKSEIYTSDKYAIHPINTIDNKFGLVEVKGFEEILSKAGFKFETLDKKIIKQEEIL